MSWFSAILGPLSNVILNIFKNKQDQQARTDQLKQEGYNLEKQAIIKKEETKKAEIEHYTDLGTAGASEFKAKLIFYIIMIGGFVGILAGVFPDQTNEFINNIKLVFDKDTIEWFKHLINSFVGNMSQA